MMAKSMQPKHVGAQNPTVCSSRKWNVYEKKSNYGLDIEGCNIGQCGWKLEIIGKILSKHLIANFKEISVPFLTRLY